METLEDLWIAYRMRWKRRRLLFRALRKRGQLAAVADRTGSIRPGDILAFAMLRNEALRLPHFLAHYRALGVAHFLIVDNSSTDGTAEMLRGAPDVSLWQSAHSYRLSRFGVDWLTWLLIKHGHGHWCLTVDADEILVYPHWQERPLPDLTRWLEAQRQPSFGALLLDMYPRGRLSAAPYCPGADPFETLCWFDGDNFTVQRKRIMQDHWIQGGVRARRFFAQDPARAPTMNKVPLVRWDRRFVYANSTHSMLPRRLNHVFNDDGATRTTGVLLHSKFLHTIVEKSREEKARKEHFANSSLYDDYYDALIDDPVLWSETSTRYAGWQQLEEAGLMSRGMWT
ncbi:glycosyl transferase family 2 [Maritimibacter sp. 55A14]|uniref:glycosyltransferase family 2 protein n=1 Tax=Maritimibacter sp. 55A14 TaxID=2174844 RepID=UPI000D60DF81|nr:glycosyltransferase family 2 protein [Maritimibacter sp. 55A14]PWE33585.1 glycosyl transferase family 2 [Maritimibacter sp. 55A14]